MKSATLKIVLHYGKGLKDVKHFGTMNPYALFGLYGMDFKLKTNIAKKGGSDPVWECSIDFGNVSMNKDYVLFIEIKHDGAVHDREIGSVQVSFADLLNGDASGDRVSYGLTISGEKQGEIILSYEFSNIVMISGEDGSNTNINKVPVAPVVRKRDKAKHAAKEVAKIVTQVGVNVAAFALFEVLKSVWGRVLDENYLNIVFTERK